MWQLEQRANVIPIRPHGRSFCCPHRRKLHCWHIFGMNSVLKGRRIMVSEGFYKIDSDYPEHKCSQSAVIRFSIPNVNSRGSFYSSVSCTFTISYLWLQQKNTRLFRLTIWSEVEVPHLGMVFLLSVPVRYRTSHDYMQGVYIFIFWFPFHFYLQSCALCPNDII